MAHKVSVVIPNYNGEEILKKNLPNVIKNCPSEEIIIVDDSSSDNSINFIRKKFKRVKILKNEKNIGFARSANRGVVKAQGNLVLLLNSDVSPQKGFLKPALNHFASDKENKLFGVALCDLSHENGRIIARGRGGAVYNKGLIFHFPAFVERGETLWVSGGSALISREKFLKLGGFDSSYAPFYWEDIDLSFRAWQTGYKCIFEPLSKVDHYHEEGAIKKNRSKNLIRMISYKNQFIFIWKNINDYTLIIKHILWLPYHFLLAIVNLDMSFFFGFGLAVLQIPALILRPSTTQQIYQVSERKVLEKFAKS